MDGRSVIILLDNMARRNLIAFDNEEISIYSTTISFVCNFALGKIYVKMMNLILCSTC